MNPDVHLESISASLAIAVGHILGLLDHGGRRHTREGRQSCF
jgi:hypothetical protein